MQTVDKIVMIPIEDIKPYENNPRKNDKTVDLLVKVIPKVGFNVPLVLDHNNVIVKGHARYLAAKKLEMQELPCVISDADPEAIKADRIADNKVFEFSKWLDEELLHEVDMLDLGIDMSEFGLPVMSMQDVPAFEEENEEDPVVVEERKRKFIAMLQQQEQEHKEVQITTQQAINNARERAAEEAKMPPKYFEVPCEKCGHVMYIREGDEMIWE